MQRRLRSGELVRIYPGIYSLGTPDVQTRLRGLDLRCGESVIVYLGTAAAMFGFDTEGVTDLHVLNPTGHLLRDHDGLKVHPAWTAVEVARSLRRPRALATLDAALRSGTCDRHQLRLAAKAQCGRRGIVAVRELIALARPEAESPMESEARLVMVDGGLPDPLLQYEILDRDGLLWRVDFAWPNQRLAVEYDGFNWHSSPDALRRDRHKRAALEEVGWRVLSIVSDDVRRRPEVMLRRIDAHLTRTAAA